MSRLEIELVPILSDNYVYLLNEATSGTTGVVDPGVAEPVLQQFEDLHLPQLALGIVNQLDCTERR